MNSLCNLLPEKFLARLQKLFSERELENVLQSMQTKPLPSFRVNTLKTTAEEVNQKLKEQDFTLLAVKWYKDAFVITNKSIRELTETEEYKQGHIYIQNLSSMIPALVLNPQQNDYILDIAAAPGSKTTQLASLMQNSGDIVANDISPKRLYRLKDNLSQAGVTNTRILSLRGESLWKRYPELFDKTLVDVPCTMEGRIKCDDPKTYQDWSTKKIKQLAKLQKYLLRSAISATKVGGTIVYSTCTFSPEENEEVIEWAVEKAAGAVSVEKTEISNLKMQPGFTGWRKKTFNHTHNTARIFPSKTMEGFFIAKLYKTDSTLP